MNLIIQPKKRIVNNTSQGNLTVLTSMRDLNTMAQKSILVGVAILYTVLTSVLGVGTVAKQGEKICSHGEFSTNSCLQNNVCKYEATMSNSSKVIAKVRAVHRKTKVS